MQLLEKYHKRKVIITDRNGKVRRYSIKRFIPMQRHDGASFGAVEDVEVLLDKARNHYFSIDSYFKGESWVKQIKILDDHDMRLKKLTPISKYKQKQMKEEHYAQTEKFLYKFLKASGKPQNQGKEDV